MAEHPETRVRMAELTGNRRRAFDLRPDASARAALMAELDLLGLEGLRFSGEMRPQGRADVRLAGRLVADVVQPCVVTLAPVPGRIDVPVERLYLAEMVLPEGDEIEMPEDDSSEPMPEVLDLSEVLTEALALALPDYPRAPGVDLGEAVFGPEGAEPLRDEALRPFAGLAALRDKLSE